MPVAIPNPFKLETSEAGGPNSSFAVRASWKRVPCANMAEAMRAITLDSTSLYLQISRYRESHFSLTRHRGLGVDYGLRILGRVSVDVGKAADDVHEVAKCAAARGTDVLQYRGPVETD